MIQYLARILPFHYLVGLFKNHNTNANHSICCFDSILSYSKIDSILFTICLLLF